MSSGGEVNEGSAPPVSGATPASGEGDVFPRQFGAYTLLGLLGSGGMGEVFLASRSGFAGIARRCVVKTLRAGFGEDREYVTRFLDEARIVVQLHHPSICPVFDVGKIGARHYLAMEYIAGRDVRTVAARAQAANLPLDGGQALHVVSAVLEALDYAHRLTDAATGSPLCLVHRDVSPHNVMIGFEGDARLIDFGLAASTMKTELTAPNVVMGKVAYMAPEQICGEHLDARADQFATAVLAYELFVGERFYEERSARETYSLASQGNFRPRKFAQLPDELRAVLDKALAAERADRFDTCGKMREAIENFRFHSGLRGDATGLRALMQQVFAFEIAAERSMLSRVGSASVPMATAPGAESMSSTGERSGPRVEATMTSRSASHSAPRDVDVSGASAASGVSLEDSSHITRSSPTAARHRTQAIRRADDDEVRRPVRAPMWIAAAGGIAIGLGLALTWAASQAKAPDPVGVAPAVVNVVPVPAPVPAVTPSVPLEPLTTTTPHDASHDAVHEPAHDKVKNKVTKRDKAVERKPTMTTAQIDYLGAHCPKLACAVPLIPQARGVNGWPNKYTDAPSIKRFKGEVADCLGKCQP